MISIISSSDIQNWNTIIQSFPMADVYYQRGYLEGFRIHGDGEPLLIIYKGESCRGICVMMKRDVAQDVRFKGKILSGKYFDMFTPYGYGGFIFDSKPSEEEKDRIKKELMEILDREGVVAFFSRFHPVLANADDSRGILDVIDLGHTIALDLSSPEVIWDNIISKNRNMIRKAEKSGVEIRHGKGMKLFDIFMDIYEDTMRRDNAEEYYSFKREFYESIDRCLHNNYEIFYAVAENEVIAISIMLFYGTQMHYHLSGSRYEYRCLAPSNLLLYKAALWGCEQGFRTFHLGGGVGSGEDNLFRFKSAFNRNSNFQFSIGKMLINVEKYKYLTDLRADTDPEFNKDSCFFPVYRS